MTYGPRLALLEKLPTVPDALKNRPKPSDYAAPFYAAFMRLHTSRADATSFIPIHAVEAYARMFAFDTINERAELLHYVTVCDIAYLNEMRRHDKRGAGERTQNRRR